MATRATTALSKQIEAQGGASVEAFCAQFDQWKAGFPDSEFTNFSFGKDGAYVTPLVDGQRYVLRHVHLAPVEDRDAFSRWLNLYRLGLSKGRWQRRTSNRVLVYVSRTLPLGGEDHLLMQILTEPDAHEIALMKTEANKHLMEQFAECAAAFIHDGTVLL